MWVLVLVARSQARINCPVGKEPREQPLAGCLSSPYQGAWLEPAVGGQGGRSGGLGHVFQCSQCPWMVSLPDLLFHVLLPTRPQTSWVSAAKAAAAPLLKRAQALLKSPRDLGALAASTAPGYWSVVLYHGGGVPMPSSPHQ